MIIQIFAEGPRNRSANSLEMIFVMYVFQSKSFMREACAIVLKNKNRIQYTVTVIKLEKFKRVTLIFLHL